MRVLCVVGSVRRGKRTDTLVRAVIDALPGVQSEVVRVADLRASPCRVICSDVCSSGARLCAIDDDVPRLAERMADADAVILASPQHFRAPPAAFHTAVERLISMAFFREAAGRVPFSLLDGKPCGLIAVTEYSNPQPLLEYLHDAALLLHMDPVRVSAFPYLGVGGQGDLATDDVFRPFARAEDLGRALALAAASGREPAARGRAPAPPPSPDMV